MRISQIKTLCWLGNGLVLVGAGYVGLHFWQTFSARSAIEPVEWPDQGGGAAIERRWPGPITGFTGIWDTAVNGLVPKPPEKVEVKRTPTDPSKIFLAKFQLLAIWTDQHDSFRSVAFLKGPGAADTPAIAIRTGQRLDGFTFVGVRPDDAGVSGLVFTHPEVENPVRMAMAPGQDPGLVGAAGSLLDVVASATDIARPPTDANKIERAAFPDVVLDPSKLTWRVPKDEVAWWEDFGESNVLAKLTVQNKQDADGNPVGVTLRSPPGQGTPVGDGRGIGINDTIKSINGVRVATKEDIVRYLREDGRTLSRYEVLVEDETGRERTVTYIVERYARS